MMTKNNSTTYSIVGSLGVHVLFTLGAGNFLMNINNNIQPQKTYQMEFVKRKAPPPVKKETIQKERVVKEIKVASLTPQAMPVLQPKVSVRQTRKAIPMVKTPISTPRQVKRVVTTKSVVMQSSKPAATKRIPMARSVAAASKTFSSKSTRMSMVQGTPQFQLRTLPQKVVRSSSSASSSKGSTRVAMVKGTVQFKLPKLSKRVVKAGSSFSSSRSTRVSLVQGAPQFKLRKLPKQVVRSGNSSSTGSKKSRAMPVQTGIKLASLTSIPSARGVPNIVDEGALRSYIGRVRQSVLGAKRYPEASRRAGREGKLKVQFTILKNGEVGNVRLLNETPYPNLNREAMAAVKRAAPFAGIPDSIMQQSLNVVLPFRFELN